MELTVHVLCRPELAPLLALVGLSPDVAGPDAAPELLRRLASDPTIGVVLVDQALHRALPLELRQRLDRQATPVVAPLPAPRWEGQGLAEEYVLEILRQAIGYRVRPR